MSLMTQKSVTSWIACGELLGNGFRSLKRSSLKRRKDMGKRKTKKRSVTDIGGRPHFTCFMGGP